MSSRFYLLPSAFGSASWQAREPAPGTLDQPADNLPLIEFPENGPATDRYLSERIAERKRISRPVRAARVLFHPSAISVALRSAASKR
jgi:hypothetical protein